MRIYETYMQDICAYMNLYAVYMHIYDIYAAYMLYMPHIGKIEVHICAYKGHIGILYCFFISTYKPYMYIGIWSFCSSYLTLATVIHDA